MALVDPPVPRLGLGTWQNTDPERCRRSVRTALEVGYRHVDTAELYGNERPVGDAIAAADVPREAVYLATKILHPKRVDGDLTRAGVRAEVRGCLDRLGVESVDLLYVHWPADYDLELVHGTLADLRDEGLIDAVGVSNYTVEHLRTALETDTEVVANQVELHPLLPQDDFRARCTELGVDVVAYAPFAHGNVFDVLELREVADANGVSIARVTLAWLRELGVAAVPKATGADHIRDNWASRELELADEEITTIEGIDRTERFFDSEYAPDW